MFSCHIANRGISKVFTAFLTSLFRAKEEHSRLRPINIASSNYGKASQSLHKRCILNRHKRRNVKLAKSGKKIIQNYFSTDTTQMHIMPKKQVAYEKKMSS